MTALYGIILAGGFKSDLWPISKDEVPGQIYTSVFKQTFLNTATLADDKNIITTVNINYVSAIKEQLKSLQEKFCRKSEYKLISEPVLKNTAPSLSIAVKYITDKPGFSVSPPVIIAVPSNQIIINRESFFSYIEKGIKLAKKGYIVAFGAETKKVNAGCSFLKVRKNPNISEIELTALKVSDFIENSENKEGLKGKLFVNSGIYMFNSKTYFSELKKCAPEIYKNTFNTVIENKIPSISLKEYEKMPDISIESALMKKSKKLVVIPTDEKWKDINSWNSIYDITNKDKNGNCFIGKTADIDSMNTMVYAEDKTVATLGLKDVLVAQSQNAVIVMDRKKTDGVKKIYKKLNSKKNLSVKNNYKTVYRPWGYYNILEEGNDFLTKCITVNPKGKLSLQRHHHRNEHWIILEGEALVTKGKETFTLNIGESINIDVEEIHSLQNKGNDQLKVMEIQQGEILEESDIERLEDIYGRV